MIRRLFNKIRFPPPYDGPILSGRIDGLAYLVGWTATFAHLTLLVCVFVLGLDQPWPWIATGVSACGTLLLLTMVLVIHRRLGHVSKKLPLDAVWQWWLGPWDPVGRLVWLPVRLPEAVRVLASGAATTR